FGIDDFHRATAQYIRRAHDQWILHILRQAYRFLDRADDSVRRLAQTGALDHLLKTLTVFRAVDRLRAGADDRHAFGFQSAGKLQRRLAAKLYDDAYGFLSVNNLDYVFQGHRFEIQSVRGGVIGGNGLRVAVDHDGFITIFTRRDGGVYTAIVEFDALTDAVWTTAEHHDFFPRARLRLTLFVIAGIHIGSRRGQLCGAGVNAFIHRAHAKLVTMVAQGFFCNRQ